MDWQTIIALAGAFGLGSVFTSILTHWFSAYKDNKVRAFEEKKAAYIALIEAIHKAAIEPSDIHAKAYALCQSKIELVGSQKVTFYTQRMTETLPNSPERMETHHRLLDEMRRDLGIERNWIVK